MAQAARINEEPLERPGRRPSPQIHVIPGRGRDISQSVGVSPLFMTIFRVIIAAFIFIALVGVARVWLTSATVSVLMSSEQLSSQISDARALGTDLQVQQTVLSNPTRIADYATNNLSMVKSTPTDYIDLGDGIVARDASGDISLSGTVAALDTSADTMLAGNDTTQSE